MCKDTIVDDTSFSTLWLNVRCRKDVCEREVLKLDSSLGLAGANLDTHNLLTKRI
jgi:hypothetical protein